LTFFLTLEGNFWENFERVGNAAKGLSGMRLKMAVEGIKTCSERSESIIDLGHNYPVRDF